MGDACNGQKTINGDPVPYDLPLSDLIQMLESKNMKDFVLSCEALIPYKSEEAYRAMKKHLNDSDK